MIDLVSKKELLPFLKLYGNQCMAYSTLQEGLEYHLVEGKGYIAYKSFWHPILSPLGRKIVLSDPIADERDYKEILESFLANNSRAIFVQIHDGVAKELDGLGYQVNQFGIETSLPVMKYELTGKAKQKLRQWSNKCQREAIDVAEMSYNSGDIGQIKEVSNDWVKRKGGHEIGFLTRPVKFEPEEDVRCFIAKRKGSSGEVLAFAIFDPIYDQGQVIGYYHNADRMRQDTPNGIGAFIILKALEQFKKENKQTISLGMSPLYKIKEEYNHHAFTSKALKYTFKNLNNLYPFEGNANHKKKFAGETNKVYISSTQGMGLGELFIMLKALGLV